MKILIATHNQSKFERYKNILSVIDDLEICSLGDLGIVEKVEENYATNVENALHKAREYGKISGLITVAVDEALMTNFLPDHEQPGVYARRFSKNKKELTDSEVIEVWREIFKLYSQEDKQFIWNFAVAYFNPQNNTEGTECIEEISYVAKHTSPLKSNGYPMSTFLAMTKNGIPYSELSQREKDLKDEMNFKNFIIIFSKWLAGQ